MKIKSLLLLALLMLQVGAWSADKPAEPAKTPHDILARMKGQCDNRYVSHQADWMSHRSKTERIRFQCLHDLKAFGKVALDEVRKELKSANGEYLQMLLITLVALGDKSAVSEVTNLMLKAESPAVRVCAASELSRLKDERLIEPFKQALADPFKREGRGCLRIGDGIVYPVRIAAWGALHDLGIPAREIMNLRDNNPNN